MKLIFMGTPAFSVPPLKALIEAGHEIRAVYTQPPRPAGRGKKPRPSPVQLCAHEYGLQTHMPINFKAAETKAAFNAHAADMAIVVAYGLILPQAVLDMPRRGCTNIHASLLPRWRGAAPIHRAIWQGDSETGISIMRMEAGLDTGPVKLVEKTPIYESDTTAILHDRLANLGAKAITRALSQWDALPLMPQNEHEACYAAKIEKSEAAIDWAQEAAQVCRQIRALSPFPGAWSSFNGVRIKCLDARLCEDNINEGENCQAPGTVLDNALTIACAKGAVQITQAQRAGKAAQETLAFLRGMPISRGTRLGV